jgi:PIN domain nuclease of toxin-antitoxin system
MEKILLDTHIFVWMITEAKRLSQDFHLLIEKYIAGRRILISAITMWEIAILVQKKRLQFSLPIKEWIEKAVLTPGITIIPLSTDILLESCLLPGTFHQDPADRMIIATSRLENAALITRDERILEYATHGFIVAVKA